MNKRKKLIWQLFPSYLLITLLSLLAVSWYASDSLRHFFLDQTAADLKIRARLLEKQIIAYLLPLDPAAVDAVCKEIGNRSATRITKAETGITRGRPVRLPRRWTGRAHAESTICDKEPIECNDEHWAPRTRSGPSDGVRAPTLTPCLRSRHTIAADRSPLQRQPPHFPQNSFIRARFFVSSFIPVIDTDT